MDEHGLCCYHCQIQLTIDLSGSDLQSIRRDDATLRQLLSEVLQAYPTEPNCELNYSARLKPPTVSACTNRTSEKASPNSYPDLTKPYQSHDGTRSPEDPVNWEWYNDGEELGLARPTYPKEK